MSLLEDAPLSDIIGELNLVRAEFDSLRDWVNELRTANPENEQILAEMRTLSHNVTTQSNAIETRITQREEKHAELTAVVESELGKPVTARDLYLEGGFKDNATGLKLKATIYAQSRFAGMMAGLENKLALGEITDDAVVYFFDATDTPTGMPLPQFRLVMSRYMDFCQWVESQFV